VRQHVTSGLEVLGALLIAAAVGLQVATWTVPGALAAAAATLLVESALLEVVRARPRAGEIE
jgi:hypothetical protein